MKKIKLTTREKIVMHEAFMTGRIYARLGEKEGPSEINKKLEENCINMLKVYKRL